MKHLKTFEEISPEYIQGKIAGKPDSPQKDRLQNAANNKINARTREENQKKSQQEEEERMKNPEYVKRKELRKKRNKLTSYFRYEKLKSNSNIKWLITTFCHSNDGVNFYKLYKK